jgi:metal-responsive CopG/Arc/MetJ family transcriptional regulator
LSDNKILVVPADLAQKIDDNRGDMSRVEFIEALIDNLVTDKHESKSNGKVDYATRTELLSFEQDMKQLLKSFLDFFIAYGMEFGENGQLLEIEKFTTKLQGLQKDLGADSDKGGGKATIKWKP